MTTDTLPLPAAVIWDLDGTLIDQTGPILRCYREVIAGLGHSEPPEDEVLRSLGGPLAATLGLFLGPDQIEEGTRRFRARFPAIMFDGLRLMPGAAELVAALAAAGVTQAALTNKHGETARAVCRHTGLLEHFVACTGSTDTEFNKPDPRLTRGVLEATGAAAEASCLVGDSPTDVETARNAGIPCYGVATGAHSTGELLEAGAAAAFEALPRLARAWGMGEPGQR